MERLTIKDIIVNIGFDANSQTAAFSVFAIFPYYMVIIKRQVVFVAKVRLSDDGAVYIVGN